jgi:hypothetical protein
MYKNLLLFVCGAFASLVIPWTDPVVCAAESAEPTRDGRTFTSLTAKRTNFHGVPTPRPKVTDLTWHDNVLLSDGLMSCVRYDVQTISRALLRYQQTRPQSPRPLVLSGHPISKTQR